MGYTVYNSQPLIHIFGICERQYISYKYVGYSHSVLVTIISIIIFIPTVELLKLHNIKASPYKYTSGCSYCDILGKELVP